MMSLNCSAVCVDDDISLWMKVSYISTDILAIYRISKVTDMIWGTESRLKKKSRKYRQYR